MSAELQILASFPPPPPPRCRQPRDRRKLQLPESLAGREEGGERTKWRWKLTAVRPRLGSGSSASPRPEASSAWALTQGGSRGAGREGSRGGGVGVGNSSGGGSVVLTGRGRNGRPGARGEWWRPWLGRWLRRARPRRVWFIFSASGSAGGLGRVRGLRAWCTFAWNPQQWRSGRPQTLAALAEAAAAPRVRGD